jgi:flagellar L-ring protein precursor FlgH
MDGVRREQLVMAMAVLACVSAIVPASVRGDSLWERRKPGRAHLFEDSRARRVGDLLTIVVSESTEVDNREDKGLAKSSSSSGKFDLSAASGGGFGISAADANLDFGKENDRSFSGEASYRNSREFSDRITVMVSQVMPNGNLVLTGHRNISIEGEDRTLIISGMVRPIDIGPDNTISSRYVANMQAVYTGEGTERRFVHQGWLGRKMNKLWPF